MELSRKYLSFSLEVDSRITYYNILYGSISEYTRNSTRKLKLIPVIAQFYLRRSLICGGEFKNRASLYPLGRQGESSMRFFLLTMDANCFDARTEDDYPEVKKLKGWQESGWVDLIKTDVFEKDHVSLYGELGLLQNIENKASDLSLDHGFSYGTTDIGRFQMLYNEILFSGVIGGKKDKIKARMCDVGHLACHSVNERDYFLTKDGHFLRKKVELERDYGIKVRTPEECVGELENLWRNNGQFPPEVLDSPKIIGGTSSFEQFCPRTPGGDLIFGVFKSENKYFIFRGMLRSPDGKELIEFMDKPCIKNERAQLFCNESQDRNRIIIDRKTWACAKAVYYEDVFSIEPEFKTNLPHKDLMRNLRRRFRSEGIELSKNPRNGILRKGAIQEIVAWGTEKNTIRTYIIREDENRLSVYKTRRILEARVLTKGHLLLWGDFFDEKGKIKVSLGKEEFTISAAGDMQI